MLPPLFAPELAAIVFGVSLALMLASVALAPYMITRIPADYFVREHERGCPRSHRQQLAKVARNLVGALLVLAGIAMLVLPGQGVLTILLGLSLCSFPGKRRLERKLLGNPAVNRVVTEIRRRAGKPPLVLELDEASRPTHDRREPPE